MEYFLPSPVIELRVESFEAILMEDDVHNKGVISPTRKSLSNVEVNTNSLRNIDHTTEILNTLKEAQVKL